MEITESNKCIVIKESTGNSQIFDILYLQFPRMNELPVHLEHNVHRSISLCLPFPCRSYNHFQFPFPLRNEYYFVYSCSYSASLCCVLPSKKQFHYSFEIREWYRMKKHKYETRRKDENDIKKRDASCCERKFINLWIGPLRQVIYCWKSEMRDKYYKWVRKERKNKGKKCTNMSGISGRS